MGKLGFVWTLLVIPVAIVSLTTILFTSVRSKKNLNQLAQSLPNPSQGSQLPADLSSLNSIIDSQLNEDSSNAAGKPNPNLLGVTVGSNYTALTFNLASTTVITDAAGDDDCTNNCPTKSLAQYVKDNGGKAGMNGTYFCPPDYSWCAGKVNSYDFPIWNNRKKKWMQASKLFWNGRGMMVFRPGSAKFFPNAAAIGAPSDITGGIVNYPPLLAGGALVLDEGSLSDNLKVTKGTRSGIGYGDGKLFLVVVRRANMKDLAGIFISLRATDALNLDGGGSVALYENGRYKTGPGRSLPNAIIIK